MKQLTFGFLLTTLLAAFTWTAAAAETILEVESATPALEQAVAMEAVAEEAAEPLDSTDPASFDFPLAPEFAFATEGGTCTPCSSHGQCSAACGGFGVCLRDFGGQCGSYPQDRFCFC